MATEAKILAEAMFRAIDSDASGSIVAAELLAAERALLDVLPVDAWDLSDVALLDADRDGVVSLSDWMQAMRGIHDTVGARAFRDACARSCRALGAEVPAAPGRAAARAWRFGPVDVEGVAWAPGTAADAEVDARLAAAASLSPEAKEVAGRMEPLRARARLGPYEWDVNVRIVRTPGAERVALFMHGHGGNCNLACWMQFWSAMAACGFHLVAFDSPGYGRSSGFTNQTMKWKQFDQDLVLGLLSGLGVPRGAGCVTVFAQCMGGAMFLRALCKSPETFAAFHVMHNCTIGTWPSQLPGLLGAKGGGLLVFWEADDDHLRESNVYKNFSALHAKRPELCTFHDLNGENPAYPILSGGAVCEGMSRGEQSKTPGTGSCCYLMDPRGSLLEDAVRFVTRAARAVGLPRPPSETAVQRGVPNKGFRVFVRARPPLPREAGLKSCVSIDQLSDWEPPEGWEGPPPDEIRVGQQRWLFDRAFGPQTSQEDVYSAVGQPILAAVVGGHGGCLLAYGQTGSGKTFTMEGEEDPGLIPRAVSELCALLAPDAAVSATYVQLYNDQLLDLFAPGESALGVVDDPGFAGGALVTGARVLDSRDPGELLASVRTGARYRASGKTNMNDASSRSHAILSLAISGPERVFHLVDLAGSERVKKSGAEGGRLEEAIAINSSLLALGNVVSALVESDGRPREHIPYRDSLLTRLLRRALGGSARTALVACVSPAEDSADETVNCLRFAARATYIRNRAEDDSEGEGALPEREALDLEQHGRAPAVDERGLATIPACGIEVSCHAGWSAGSGAPLVVFLHHYGFGATGGMWSFLFDRVHEAGGRYLAPSMPGHGETPGASSSKPEDLGKQGGPVDLLKALLDWTGTRKAILVGFDWGGGIAAEFAILHPKRVQHLALWCMSYRDEGRLQQLSKRGKDILFLWDKNDPNRSEKKGRAFAKALKAKYQEWDCGVLCGRLEKWIRAAGRECGSAAASARG